MPSPMRLRKSIKPPKRYEDELGEGGHLIRSPSVTSQPKAYRGKVIEHNPDLPPAAFPTLDPRRPTPPRTNQQQLNHQKMPSNQRNHAHSPTASPPHQQPATNFSNRDLNHPFSLRDPVFDYPLDNMTGFDPSSQQHMDNGVGNPIWERNMALLDGFEQRTDLEWEEAEMATSDEGSPTSRTRKENALLIGKVCSHAGVGRARCSSCADGRQLPAAALGRHPRQPARPDGARGRRKGSQR